jgi:hypothetical protein
MEDYKSHFHKVSEKQPFLAQHPEKYGNPPQPAGTGRQPNHSQGKTNWQNDTMPDVEFWYQKGRMFLQE